MNILLLIIATFCCIDASRLRFLIVGGQIYKNEHMYFHFNCDGYVELPGAQNFCTDINEELADASWRTEPVNMLLHNGIMAH
jgi:hypothetical protein